MPAGICEGRVVHGDRRRAGASAGSTPSSSPARAPRWSINDLGAEVDGTGSSPGPAGEVVDAIRAMGGEAVANGDDVADADGAARMVQTAVDTFGRLDVLVNNAGILRDRMLVNMTPEEWDDGHPGPPPRHLRHDPRRPAVLAGAVTRPARTTTPASSTPPRRRASTATSGQTNYGAAKAGIAAFTVIAAMEVGRYGVTVNCHRPVRPDPDDREPRDGPAGGASGRRGSSTPMPPPTSPRWWSGSAAPNRRASPAGSSTSPAATSAWPRDGSPARRPTRRAGGTRPSSATVVPDLVAKAAAERRHAGPART